MHMHLPVQAAVPPVAGAKPSVSFSPTLLDADFSLHKAPEVTAHALVTGATSENKVAAVTKLLELLSRDNPALVWLTDDGSLEHEAAEWGLPYLNLEPAGAGSCLNPFWRPVDRDGLLYRPSLDETLNLSLLLLQMLEEVGYRPQDEHVSAILPLLFKAVSRTYSVAIVQDPRKEITLSDFMVHLNEIQVSGLSGADIGQLLKPYYGDGQFAGLFDGKLSLQQTEDAAIFGTQALAGTPAISPAVSALQLHCLKRLMFEFPRLERKAFVVSHDWKAHQCKHFGRILESLFREYRRYGASLILMTDSCCSLQSAIGTWGLGNEEDGLLENLCHHLEVVDRAGHLELSYSAMDDSTAARECGLVTAS
ncbi:hypothetical protein ACSVIJ_05350 [Pseudomonas sp. NCHU5208]|uniref:hypothetical protein n=1 Tax=unclassified Pseudomonas TaxID=196821 RepID=UPI003F98A73F